jgi:hypothetical protein
MAFKNYDEFPAPKPVRLPMGEKTYSFPGTISARAWVLVEKLASRLQRAKLAEIRGETYDPDEEALSDLEYADVRAEVFGDTEREMIEDGLTSDHLKRAFYALVSYHMNGQEAAEVVWNQGGSPAPNRAQRRSKARTPTRSRGSHAGSTASKAARPGTRSSVIGR